MTLTALVQQKNNVYHEIITGYKLQLPKNRW